MIPQISLKVPVVRSFTSTQTPQPENLKAGPSFQAARPSAPNTRPPLRAPYFEQGRTPVRDETRVASWLAIGIIAAGAAGLYFYLNHQGVRPQNPAIQPLQPLPIQL